MRRKYPVSIFIALVLFSAGASSQNLSAWLDYRDYLQVFDNGMYHSVEYLPVKNYKIGGSSVAYIDHKNDFKIYEDGKSQTLLNAADFSYFMTDYLVGFKVGSVLYVYHDGERRTLSYYNSILAINDSVMAYFDDSKSTLNVYYDGKDMLLEDSFLELPKAIKTGANIVAWVNQSNYFNVFYRGNTIQLDNIPPVHFEAGRDIVAYIDGYERQFRLLYKGDTARVEEFQPDSFKVGFAIMAYVDNLGNFRVFRNGSTERLIPDRPDFFEVMGNTVVYSYNNSFNAYYNGQVVTLQNRTPESFITGNDGVAWLDDSGRLMLFHKGKIHTVSYEIINKYYLNGNVLKYETGNNTVNIFFNGQNY